MTNNLPADYHMHSSNSGDCDTPMKDMIESAISHGLSEICFTDHMDLDFQILEELPKGTFDLDIPTYHNEVLSYQKEYQDKITIKYGIELGLQSHLVSENANVIKSNDFDFVIGSIHLVDKKDPYYPYLWADANEYDIIRRFFELTLENVRLFDDFDVLGHLDYIVRYAPSGAPDYSYEVYKDVIDEILKVLVGKGKGLDLNTKAALFKGGAETNPSKEILKRFHELGGRIITFGSDAHVPVGIASSFDRAVTIAKECGFQEYYTFEKRTPTAHKL